MQKLHDKFGKGFFGEEIQRLQKGTDELKVWVRYPLDNRKEIGDLEKMRIKTPQGGQVQLAELIDYDN